MTLNAGSRMLLLLIIVATMYDSFALRMSLSPTVKWWYWKGHKIRFQVADANAEGPPMVCIHGFGGSSDHWRKNLPELSQTGPTYAIDLLGYGYSDKPAPGSWEERNGLYNFENWASMVRDFIEQEVQRPSFLVCNSVGGLVGLQAAVDDYDALKERNTYVLGCVIFNISLRMLHEKKQSPFIKPFVKCLQWTLRQTPIGPAFFQSVATPRAVGNILRQCYSNPAAVTDELVDAILKPGLTMGAAAVFLDFICYSTGPLAEELLPKVKVPVIIGWGADDPWEPINLGRTYADFPCVTRFVELPAGHCPQDEIPNITNGLIRNFVLSSTTNFTYVK
jgi:pimeloyl-ACP methyl ester carboxylesterase